MAVTQLRREYAVILANEENLGKTAGAIQDGCSPEEAYCLAVLEFKRYHKHCPCCRGCGIRATEMAKTIFLLMTGPETSLEK